MGINTGYCTVGNSGSEDRLDYTIVGKEVVGIRTKRHRGPIVERVGAFDFDRVLHLEHTNRSHNVHHEPELHKACSGVR